jgi:hypothetical protein
MNDGPWMMMDDIPWMMGAFLILIYQQKGKMIGKVVEKLGLKVGNGRGGFLG